MAKSVSSSTRTLNGNLYRSKIIENDDASGGGFSTELYRVGSDGTETKIFTQTPSSDDAIGTKSEITKDITTEEISALKDPNSSLNKIHDNGVKESVDNFFTQNPSEETKNNINQVTGESGNTATANPEDQSSNSLADRASFITNDISKKTPVPKGDNATYPIDIKDTKQDRIKFTAVTLAERTLAAPIEYVPVSGDVYISIQGPIADQNKVVWGDSKITALDVGLGQVAQTVLDEGVGEGIDSARSLLESAMAEYKGKISSQFAALAAGNIDIFTRGIQQAFNPNLELLFKDPQLRPFSFEFKMSARDENEAKEIKKIIKYFKYHMAVKKTNGFIFLKAPDVFWIEYQKGTGNTHQSLNLIAPGEVKYKACALQDFNVSYTPLGSYMTFDDEEATMVQYNLTLSFSEIIPIYQSDYEEGPYADHSIGY
jgi:hypothetical protein